jgi:hypothetical protein
MWRPQKNGAAILLKKPTGQHSFLNESIMPHDGDAVAIDPRPHILAMMKLCDDEAEGKSVRHQSAQPAARSLLRAGQRHMRIKRWRVTSCANRDMKTAGFRPP